MEGKSGKNGVPADVSRIGFLPGDGIGPEVAWPARRCVEAVGAAVEWEKISTTIKQTGAGRGMPAILLMAPIEGGYGRNGRNPLSDIKEAMAIHASVRRLRSFACGPGPAGGMDMLVIRPEGPPASFSREFRKGDPGWTALPGACDDGATAASLRFMNLRRSAEFFEFAFALAQQAGRKKVTVAHRTNVFSVTDRDWLKCAEDVSRRFPGLELEDQLVDYMAMQMARSPQRYDAVVVSELYGDIIGDLGVGLVGGLGMVPQAYYGAKGTIFTTVHGTAPKYAGLERANPCAMILTASEMLGEIGEDGRGALIVDAVRAAFEAGLRTPDLVAWPETGQAVGTGTFANAVLYNIKAGIGTPKGRPVIAGKGPEKG